MKHQPCFLQSDRQVTGVSLRRQQAPPSLGRIDWAGTALCLPVTRGIRHGEQGTGCESFTAQTSLAGAKVYGHSSIRRRYSQKNAWCFVAAPGMGMRLIAMVFGPHTPKAQTARLPIFSHYFKR